MKEIRYFEDSDKKQMDKKVQAASQIGDKQPTEKKSGTEGKEESAEELARRLRIQRRKRELRRRRRRRALMIRVALAAVLILLLVVLIWLIFGGKKDKVDKKNETQDEQTEEIVMEAVDTDKVLHLSFRTLIADPDMAFGQEDVQAASLLDQSCVTVDEFNQILQQLYDQGYILVKMEDLAAVNQDGMMEKKNLMLPQGKKPLILSQKNVNYDLSLYGQGIASKLLVDENGRLVNELVQSDGSSSNGVYDVVTCVEAFVENHPDFSLNNARGILGVTGYNGILGYETATETDLMKSVVEELKVRGWEFACNGYKNISYAQDLSVVQSDMEQWRSQAEALVGTVDKLIFPDGKDIGNWSVYSEDNEVYQYLKNQGFRYYCGLDISGPWSQLTEEYLRCSYKEVDGYRMYQDVYQNGGRFTGILDFSGLYDMRRPSAPKEAEPEI